MTTTAYDSFLNSVRELHAARAISALLDWDQETYMPPGSAEDRAVHTAFMAGLAHERLIGDEFGRLLEQLAQKEADGDYARRTNVREMCRERDRAVKIPKKLVEEIARTTTLSRNAWGKARTESHFATFSPHLQKLLDLKREVADLIGWQTEPYDALMDEFEPGAKAAAVQDVFDAVKNELVPLVSAIAGAPRKPDGSLRTRHCPRAAQVSFNRRVVESMGFDFQAGRIDVSAHPFCTSLSPRDVRFTTRYDERFMTMSLFGVMHEAGHALYEQGFDVTHTGTPMAKAVSLGIHESQSRLWENQVGRSHAFWRHFFPPLKESFPCMADVALNDWVHVVNTVAPSFIRVEADEVTYGLHIMLRFDIERRLMRGELAVNDIPEAWNCGMRELLGVTPPNDGQGCLQDIHWSLGIFGYFPTYALGNLFAAQFFEAAQAAIPELEEQIERGELLPLREWLRENIHRHGMPLLGTRTRAQRHRSRAVARAVCALFADQAEATLRPGLTGSQSTCTTSRTSGIRSFSARSTPIFNVIAACGQPEQAPFKRTVTVPSSFTSTRSMSPPSPWM